MRSDTWQFFWEWITGFGLGFEWMETDEEEAIVLEVFLIRFVWLREFD